MAIIFRYYSSQSGYHVDFFRVCEFLRQASYCDGNLQSMEWVRWEWTHAMGMQRKRTYEKVGLWEEDGRIVGLATLEDDPGHAWLVTDAAHDHLKPEMLLYARDHLHEDGVIRVSINDCDRPLQRYALQQGFRPTQEKEPLAAMDITDEITRYTLPDGFRIISFDEELDIYKYNRVLWRGFNHEGPAPEDDASLQWRRDCLTSPHANPHLALAVVAPNGEYVSHSYMWHQQGDEYAILEPMATDPDYRRMGLGRAALLEGIRRCGELGAKVAYAGLSQQFYYSVGSYPRSTDTFWEYKLK